MLANEKIEKLREDLTTIIERGMSHYFGADAKKAEEELKNEVNYLLWEYEMQNFIN